MNINTFIKAFISSFVTVIPQPYLKVLSSDPQIFLSRGFQGADLWGEGGWHSREWTCLCHRGHSIFLLFVSSVFGRGEC